MADTATDGSSYTCALTGEGIIDLPANTTVLKEQGCDGYVTLEFPYVSGGGHREKLESSYKKLIALLNEEETICG